MSEKEKPLSEAAWERVLNEITDPGDWVAAGIGAVFGGIGAVIAKWPDWLTLAATGATAGVTFRKAWNVERRRPQLRRRSIALEKIFAQVQGESPIAFPSPELDPHLLRQVLRREMTLWEERAISNEQFISQLDELVSRYRSITTYLDTRKKELPVSGLSNLPVTGTRKINLSE